MQHRIVSLLPSSTEMVCALGFQDQLVGRSHECDYPLTVEHLPLCSRPKLNPKLSSAAIHHQVQAVVEEGLSLYQIDAEMLRRLQPTLIITQVHCKVCAVSLDDVQRAVCHWLDQSVLIVALEPTNLSAIWQDILRVAEALQVPERGHALVESLQQRMAAIAEQTKNLPRRTVATIEWIDPIMTGGHWFPTLVDMAGGINLFGQDGRNSTCISFAQLQEADPEVIVILPCGFDIPRTRQELSPLLQHPEWPNLSAVRTGQVFLTDGHQFFNRPGPRIVESLEILAEILHPLHFNSNHRNHHWQPL